MSLLAACANRIHRKPRRDAGKNQASWRYPKLFLSWLGYCASLDGTLRRRELDLQQHCVDVTGKRSLVSLSVPLQQVDRGRLIGIGHMHRHNKSMASLYGFRGSFGLNAGRQ